MSWVWWAVGTFGVGGVVLIGAVLIFGWPAVIGTRIGRIVLAIGVAIVAAFGVYQTGRAKGRAAERAKLKALTEKEVGVSAAERKRIDALTDEQVDEELGKWDRKS